MVWPRTPGERSTLIVRFGPTPLKRSPLSLVPVPHRLFVHFQGKTLQCRLDAVDAWDRHGRDPTKRGVRQWRQKPFNGLTRTSHRPPDWRIVAGLVLSAVFALAATTQALATQPDPEHKVTICHRTELPVRFFAMATPYCPPATTNEKPTDGADVDEHRRLARANPKPLLASSGGRAEPNGR
jgi:hypothetical protein